MDTCIIKNCNEEAYEEGMCAKHYVDFIKKVMPEEMRTGKKKPEARAAWSEEMPEKTEFLLQSVFAHVEKLTDSMVNSFDNVFSLTKNETAKIYRQMGSRFLEKSDGPKAISYLTRVVELNPEDVDSKYYLGTAYYLQGSYDEAVEYIEQAIKLSPDNADYHFGLGVVYEQKGLYDKAVTSLGKAAKLNPDNPEIHYRLGSIFDVQEKFKQAVNSFQKAIELNPKRTDYYQSLGFTYESMDQHAEAVKCYKKAMFLNKPTL